MATSTARRVVEPPSEPVRSEERQRLAQALAAHKTVADRFDRLQAALGRAQAERVEKFVVIEGLEMALEEAREAEPRRRAALLIGDPDPGGRTIAETEGALEAARADHRVAGLAITALEAELGGVSGARYKFEVAQHEVDTALNAVIAAEAGEAVASAYTAAKLRAGVLRDLGLFLKMKDWRLGNIEIPAIIPPGASLVDPWRSAVERLKAGEIDAVLPEII